MTLYGFDINGNKGNEPGILDRISREANFVILKATEGKSWRDQSTPKFAERFRQEGKKVGWYHYPWPANQVEEELANFLAWAKPLPGETLWLDFEPYRQGTNPATWPAWIRKFLSNCYIATGALCGVYFNNDIGRQAKAHATTEEWQYITSRPLWKAYYDTVPGDLLGWNNYAVWQYSANVIDQDRIEDHDLWDKICIPREVINVSGIIVSKDDPTDPAFVPVKRSFVNANGQLIAIADLPVPPPPPPPPPPPISDGIGVGDVWIGLLKFGTIDSDSVRRMQRQLKIEQSGNYDSPTDEAVRNWQSSIGDTPDPAGQSSIGPLQAQRLFEGSGDTLKEGVPGNPTKPPGGAVSKVFADRLQLGVTDSDSVRAVQEALNRVSFPPHQNIPVNGNYDETTKNMAAAFQTFIGNSADGLLGPKQTAKLFEMAGMQLEWHDEPSGGGSPGGGGGGSGGGTIDTPYPGATVSYEYGVRNPRYAAGFHTGRDYGCGVGTPLRSTWTSTVVATNAWGAAYGNHVIMEHAGIRIAYCHMSRIDVRVGAQLVPGTHVGLSGDTGNVSGAHVHVEARTAPYGYNNVVHPPQL